MNTLFKVKCPETVRYWRCCFNKGVQCDRPCNNQCNWPCNKQCDWPCNQKCERSCDNKCNVPCNERKKCFPEKDDNIIVECIGDGGCKIKGRLTFMYFVTNVITII